MAGNWLSYAFAPSTIYRSYGNGRSWMEQWRARGVERGGSWGGVAMEDFACWCPPLALADCITARLVYSVDYHSVIAFSP